jgi:hypothetical protein
MLRPFHIPGAQSNLWAKYVSNLSAAARHDYRECFSIQI